MKSRKTNKKTWLSAAIGFAFLILFAQPQRAGAQQWTTNGNHISNTNSGNVGIGTTSPNDKLEVVGQVRTSGSIGGFVMMPRVGNGALSVWYNPTGTDTRLWNSNIGDTLSILSSGNVGIGTMSPGRLVEIRENNTGLQTQLRLFHGNGDSGFNPGSTEIEFLHAGNQLATSKMRIVRTFNGTGSSNTDFYLDLVRGNGSNNGNTTNTALFAQGLTGNLGIDTTSPGYRLDVQGGQINASGGLCIAADCKTAWSQVGGAVASVFGRTGAVVTATNDYTWAQINKTTSSLADLTTRSASDLSSGTIPDARFPATLPSASGANLTALNASSLGGGTVATARLGSGTADASTFLRGDNTWAVPSGGSQWTTSGANINYAPAGNVGIGTGTPAYKLHVTGDGKFTGNLTVDGNIAAKYQDVAEWVPASERISPGTVVVLDSTKSNQVISSTQAYDTRVAGVISEKPGIALGERGDNKVLVATTGRVRIKVDATRGPISIGDLLVTSDIIGMAMKSEPVTIGGVKIHRPGTLIGKALEPLAKGQGEILVLLSLQ